MNKIDDGGPAFPFPGEPEHLNCPVCDSTIGSKWIGMSLRDWFAGQALSGLVTTTDYGGHKKPRGRDELEEFAMSDAEEAYRIADAMLAERKAKD